MNPIVKFFTEHFIKPSIVFESVPPFADNTKPVYDEMVRRGYEKKYNLIWYISEDECATIKNGEMTYWNPHSRKTLREKIRNYSYYLRTKCIICCNTYITSRGAHKITDGKGQLSFYLTHGTPMKSVRAYYAAPEGTDYGLSPAPSINQLMSQEFEIPLDHIFAAGFPRNDVFAKNNPHLNDVFHWNYNKVIVWYPTYRQKANHSMNLAGSSMPLIHDERNAELLNQLAKENNVLIVIKPHFAQDVSLIRKMNYSNLMLINDEFYKENNITSYEFLAGTDAMITDYSSVYFDYTLVDKPIAVIWEDIEEYRKNPGFAMDLTHYLKGAEKIYKIEELCDFVTAIANGEDKLRDDRRSIRDEVNYSTDGQNAKRVVDFITKTAKL